MFTPDSVRAPAKPLSLSANPNTTTIVLDWNIVYDDDLAGYNVYRSTVASGTYQLLNSTPVSTNSFTDTTITLDVLYYYYVTAIDTFGNESSASEIAQAAATLRPDWPENVKGTVADSRAYIYWDPVLTTTISGYNVYQSVSSSTDGFSRINADLIEDTHFAVSDLSNNSVYYYVVTAIDASDEESYYSDPVTLTPVIKVILQAEDGVIVSAEVETEHTGFNGTGYVNFAESTSSVTFNGVYADTDGSYYLLYRYALGKDARTGLLTVNTNSQSCIMNNTGAFTTYVYDSIAVQMNSGFDNIITFATTGSDFGNFDEIQLGTAIVNSEDAIKLQTSANTIMVVAPNPLNESTQILLNGLEAANYTIVIYNLLGQPVTQISFKTNIENRSITWNGTSSEGKKVSYGPYFINLIKNNQLVSSERIVINR